MRATKGLNMSHYNSGAGSQGFCFQLYHREDGPTLWRPSKRAKSKQNSASKRRKGVKK